MWAAVATSALGLVTAVIGFTTPPRSGPMCRLDSCVTWPYTEVAAFVPRDYLWLYPALALQAAFLLLVAAVASRALASRPVPALAAVSFAVVGSALLVADYGLQLFVVQPSLLADEAAGLALLSQYNPHGVFIGLENLGYSTVAAGLVFLGVTLDGLDRPARVARWVLLGGGALTWVALVGLTSGYGVELGYRFELVAISVFWLVAVIAGAALAVTFHRAGRPAVSGDEG